MSTKEIGYISEVIPPSWKCFDKRLQLTMIFLLFVLATASAFGGPERYARQAQGKCEAPNVCVPYYLCKAGEVITDGEGILDVRAKPGSGGSDVDPSTLSTDLVGGNCPGTLELCCKAPIPASEAGKEVGDFKPQCGRRYDFGIDIRIVYDKTAVGAGNQAQPGEFPWMTAVLGTKTVSDPADGGKTKVINVYACGGSLIHPQVVLTAAHCVEKQAIPGLKVRLGEWDTKTTAEIFQHQDRDVVKTYIHEKYYNKALFEDIALLILDKPVDLNHNIDTICLAPPSTKFENHRCVATGWGKDDFGATGTYQTILKMVELPVIPTDKCLSSLRKTRLGSFFCLHDTFLCAGGEKADTCKGDGGSPLVCQDPKSGYYYQAGIVAWGIGCGNGVPGVYVDVPRYGGWIDDKIKQHFNLPTSYFGFSKTPEWDPTDAKFQQCRSSLSG